MDIRPIRTAEDHETALARIDALWGADPGTPEGDELDVLAELVAAYEDRHHSLPPSPPHEIVRAAMEERGDGFAELARMAGSEAAARAVLAGGEMTLDLIRSLHREWDISAELLIREPGRAVA